MAVAKRRRREKPAKMNKGKSQDTRTRVRTSGKTNNTPGRPNLHKTGPGTEKHIKKGAKALVSLSLSLTLCHVMGRSSLCFFGSTGFSCYYLNKIEL